MRLYLNDCGVICPLGSGRQAVMRGLDAAVPRLVARDGLLPGRTAPVGAVAEVPHAGFAAGSRNNRMMQAALDQIAGTVAAAVRRYGRGRVAVVLGTSTSGIAEGELALAQYRQAGVWPDGYHYHQQETGSLGIAAAAYLGVDGPAYTLATACSASAKVFASARRLIRAGMADAVVAGGADTLCRLTLNGFDALQALSPTGCNPFSRNRNGIAIGEGAAAFLVSAEPGPVELLGVGETSDAHHATAPHPEGEGARAAMAAALHQAGLEAAEIAYVNLHGTATPLNDAMEGAAMARIFPPETPCSSTKGMTGHMLGATGGVEAAFLFLCLDPASTSGFLPAHVWDEVVDPDLPVLNLVRPGAAVPGRGRVAMLSNSFGFGGSNAAVILGRAG